MFEIELFDNPEILKLLAGSSPLTGFNTRLDILTALEPRDLTSRLDQAYDEAILKAEEHAKDPEVQEKYERGRMFRSATWPGSLPPKEDYLEGQNGPPLGKGVDQNGSWAHPILKTIVVRDYGMPQGDYAYSNVREQLRGYQGHFIIVPFARDSDVNVVPASIHDRFDFEPKSDAVLTQFVLGMMNLYGNYSPAALEAKMMGVAPTTEEGMAQRDAIKKLGDFFHDNSIPFYATFHNPRNSHSVLIYGLNSNGNSTTYLAFKPETKELPPSPSDI